MGWTQADPKLTHELVLQIGVFCAGLFIACMFCHGELVRLKPAPSYLTRFYLMISLGGAVGAVLVGIVAPLVLPAHFELALAASSCVALLLALAGPPAALPCSSRSAAAAVVATIGCGVWSVREFYDDVIVAKRNFYGVLRVTEWGRDDQVEPPPLADPWHDPARAAVPGAGSQGRADDATTRRPPASAGCSSRCTRARTRSRSA